MDKKKKHERSELDKQLEKKHKSFLSREITKRALIELAIELAAIGAAAVLAYLIELLLDFA